MQESGAGRQKREDGRRQGGAPEKRLEVSSQAEKKEGSRKVILLTPDY